MVVFLPQKQRMAVGALLGRLSHKLAGKRAFVAQRNIELCFPDLSPDEQRALTRKHFESLGKMAVEMGMSWWMSDAELKKIFVLEGQENIDEALSRDKGVLMLCGHFAGVELSGRRIVDILPPMAAMYRPNNNPLLNTFMWRSRSKSIPELITKNSVRQLLRALKNKKPVWYAPDQAYTGKNSVLADFCGVPAMCNPATSQLLKTSGATLVPFLPSRLADDSGYKVIFLPMVETLPTDDVVADTNAINRILEKHIREYPEQYYWVHRRFKARPAPLADAYARTKP
jgi:KDO2-lipid IV(A) lauroyltransferase